MKSYLALETMLIEAVQDYSLADILESLIDRHSPEMILSASAQICEAKSEHLQFCWQDASSAIYWLALKEQLEQALFPIECDRVA